MQPVEVPLCHNSLVTASSKGVHKDTKRRKKRRKKSSIGYKEVQIQNPNVKNTRQKEGTKLSEKV